MLRVEDQAFRSDTGRQRSANEDSYFVRGYRSDVFQRALDSETLAFEFRGEHWDLDALADELAKIEKSVIRQQAKIKQW
jgi:hypothetical protein